MTTLIASDVYAPGPMRRRDVVAVGGRIVRIGAIDLRTVGQLGVTCDVIYASGCVVTPSLIDHVR